jgi:hypothetical protein
VAGREYLIEFPGLGDKRQFRWETEAKLLQTAGNGDALVAYDRLRDAERRAAPVPVVRPAAKAPNAALVDADVAVAAPASSKPKRVTFSDSVEAEKEANDDIAVAVAAPARSSHVRRASLKVRESDGAPAPAPK